MKIGAVLLGVGFGAGGCSDGVDGDSAAVPVTMEISPDDRFIGSADAPLTIIEYASTTCGACASFHARVFKQLKETYIDTGKVRLVLREFPTPPKDRAKAAFMLARCVPEERYFNVLDSLFRTQSKWILADNAQAALREMAKANFGLDDKTFDDCLTNADERKRIDEVVETGARTYGVDSTPSFVINGRTYENMGFDQFRAILDPLVGP